MSANVSQRKRRANALANRVGDLPGWFLHVDCRCGHRAHLALGTLASEERIATVLPRLRCQQCRAPPGAVLLANGSSSYSRAVKLLGTGAMG